MHVASFIVMISCHNCEFCVELQSQLRQLEAVLSFYGLYRRGLIHFHDLKSVNKFSSKS